MPCLKQVCVCVCVCVLCPVMSSRGVSNVVDSIGNLCFCLGSTFKP